MVQLDHDEEMDPMHGMYGTLEAELEVQRTIKIAELTAFSGRQSVPRWCTLTTNELLTGNGKVKRGKLA